MTGRALGVLVRWVVLASVVAAAGVAAAVGVGRALSAPAESAEDGGSGGLSLGETPQVKGPGWPTWEEMEGIAEAVRGWFPWGNG